MKTIHRYTFVNGSINLAMVLSPTGIRAVRSSGARKWLRKGLYMLKALILVAGALWVMLGLSAHGEAAAPVVKIGVVEPLSGNAAAAGQATKAAIEVAADIINKGHPELARLPPARPPRRRSRPRPRSSTMATPRSRESRSATRTGLPTSAGPKFR